MNGRLIIGLYVFFLPIIVFAKTYRDWHTDCSEAPSKCRGYTTTTFMVFEGGDAPPPTVLMFTVENEDATVSALVTEKQYRKLFTGSPPVELEVEGTRYVPEKNFFNKRFPVELEVGGRKIATMNVLDDAHAHLELNETLITNLKSASQIHLSFAHSLIGKGSACIILSDGIFRSIRHTLTNFSNRRAEQ